MIHIKLPRIQPYQVLLFAPACLLALALLMIVHNSISRPIIFLEEFPERQCEVLVYIEYPPAYPFSGKVQAVLEVHRSPGRETVFTKPLESHRWAGEAIEEYRAIDWTDPDRIILHSRDRKHSQIFRVPSSVLSPCPEGERES